MAQHLTEEEQLETLKRWWSENGRSIVIGVVLAIVAYFGWQAWQSQQQEARESASLLYEQLTQVVINQPGDALSEDQRMKAASITEELKSDYGNLVYASNAALLMARVAVEQGQLTDAEQQLRWVVEQDHNDALSLLARLRLAQVEYGQGEYDAALATLNQVEPGSYASAYAELRGDILLAQGKVEAAKTAYQTALDEMLPTAGNRGDLIQMKLDDIQVNADDAAESNQANATEADS